MWQKDDSDYRGCSLSVMCNIGCGLVLGRKPSASFSHLLGIKITAWMDGCIIPPSSFVFIRGRMHELDIQGCFSDFQALWNSPSFPLSPLVLFLLTLPGRKNSLFEYIPSVANLSESETKADALADLNLPCLIMPSTFFRSHLVSLCHTPAMLSGSFNRFSATGST